MATPATLASAADAYSVQAQIAAAAVAAARRLRNPTAVRIAELVVAYQLLAAQQGSTAVPTILAEQGVPSATVATVALEALVGLTSSGYPLSVMFETINSPTQLAMLVASAVQDAGRNGASLQMAVTPTVEGYVRMLNPPSCADCIILAGKFFRWNQGFERHPMCDCRHIPATENLAGDLLTDSDAYFASLPREEQDRLLGSANAQAVRDGADLAQVVNASKKVSKAQVFGRDVLTTSAGGRRKTRASVRLMPESIYQLAKDREDAIRLLRLHGFVL